MMIEVGFDMNSIRRTNWVITGNGTIYSRDSKEPEEFYDDFFFTYEIDTDSVIVGGLDEDVFGEYLELIEAEIKENIKTNIL